jgi:trimeric autotransporter adhesin
MSAGIVTDKSYLTIGFLLLLASGARAQTCPTATTPSSPWSPPANATICVVAGGLSNSAGSVGNPNGVAVDTAGNVYIADGGDNVVYFESSDRMIFKQVAGNGTSGYSGDGGSATSAELAYPSGLIVDSSGNIFIADSNNNRIREVVKSTGNIITVAGNGTFGYSGDGGLATSAELAYPTGVAVDSSGNLFIADSSNNRVRKVDASSKNISTIAGNGSHGYGGDGGPATSAGLNFPIAVAMDSSGDLFIADTFNNRIREVIASTKNIITVAGNGTQGFSGDGGPAISAGLYIPYGVALDSSGNIFVADTYDNRIREVVASTGNIITVTGTGTPGFLGDGSAPSIAELDYPDAVAIDSSNDIFIADYANLRIREIVNSTSIIQTFAGGAEDFGGTNIPATNARLAGPIGVLEDPFGNIFFNDSYSSYTLESVFTSASTVGKIQAVAGTGTAGFGLDGGSATLAKITFPSGIAEDSLGDIYIADTENQRIRVVNTSTSANPVLPGKDLLPGAINTVAGNGTFGYSGDGGPATGAELAYPYGLAVDSSGNVFIADTNNNRIREVVASTLTKTIITVAGNGSHGYSGEGGPATNAELAFPAGVTVDSSGNLFIADTYNNRIRKVDASTKDIITVAGNGTQGFSGDGGPATSAELAFPDGVAVDGSGNLFIADTINNRIREVLASTHNIITIAGGGTSNAGIFCPAQVTGFGDGCPATSAELLHPRSVWGDQAGNLLIADTDNNRIRKVYGVTSVPGLTLSVPGPFTGSQQSQTLTLTNSGTAPLVISSIAITPPTQTQFQIGAAATTPCPTNGVTLQAGEICNLVIALTPSVISQGETLGTVSGNATLTVTDNAAVSIPTGILVPTPPYLYQQTTTLNLNYAAPVISFSPASLTFTTQNVPSPITLTNNGSTAMSITSIAAPAGFALSAATSNACATITPSSGAPLTLAPATRCDINVSFTGGSSSGDLTITDNAFSSPQKAGLNGSALIVSSGPSSFTISNSSPTTAMATLEVLGPASATYNLVCTLAPAGLEIVCPATADANATFTVSILAPPSCSTSPIPPSLPKGNSWPLYALIASLGLSLLICRRQMAVSRRVYAGLAIAVICFSGSLSSCAGGGIKTSGGCVATVATGPYVATITAIPVKGQVGGQNLSPVTTVPSISITVTK